MRISDWSSDVCSSDLAAARRGIAVPAVHVERQAGLRRELRHLDAAPDSIGLVRAEPIARFGRGEQAAHHDLLRTDLPARARLHRLREAAEQPFLLIRADQLPRRVAIIAFGKLLQCRRWVALALQYIAEVEGPVARGDARLDRKS